MKRQRLAKQEPIEVKKRLEEVRLLESRRSARLADQDRNTDFARLADMVGDRRRTSHSIDVPATLTPPPQNSRKRVSAYAYEQSESFQFGNEEEMDECNAALILMKLSNSPKSPQNGEKWLGSSPGSSSASWSSGSSSPPLSDDGQPTIISNSAGSSSSSNSNSNLLHLDAAASARMRTTSVSTSDEGIVMDYTEDRGMRKRRANKPTFKCTWKGCDFIEHTAKKIERHIRNAHLGNKKPRRSADCDGSFSESDHEEEFYYTEIEDDDDDATTKQPSPPSQPTLSHRDMARPPHEDPEYQRQIVGNFKTQGRAAYAHMANGQQQYINHGNNNKGLLSHIGSSAAAQQMRNNCSSSNNNSCLPTSPLAHHKYTWPSAATSGAPTAAQQQHSPVTVMKHARYSPRPSAMTAPYRTYVHHQQQQQQHYYNSNSSSSVSSTSSCASSPNNVLEKLSQHNVTVTTHHHSNGINQQQQQQQQLHQMSTVTITPNYNNAHHTAQTQQHMRHLQPQQQSPTTTANSHAHLATHTHSTQQQQHVTVQHVAAAARHTPNSPNRRTRGENKKCRKVYGMERRDQWCTQCKWKKACSRFGD